MGGVGGKTAAMKLKRQRDDHHEKRMSDFTKNGAIRCKLKMKFEKEWKKLQKTYAGTQNSPYWAKWKKSEERVRLSSFSCLAFDEKKASSLFQSVPHFWRISPQSFFHFHISMPFHPLTFLSCCRFSMDGKGIIFFPICWKSRQIRMTFCNYDVITKV